MTSLKKAMRAAVTGALSPYPILAIGAGTLAPTVAIRGLAGEFTGPLAYGLSLIGVVGGGIALFRNHHDMTSTLSGIAGIVFIAGIALGAVSLLGLIPGVAGALV